MEYHSAYRGLGHNEPCPRKRARCNIEPPGSFKIVASHHSGCIDPNMGVFRERVEVAGDVLFHPLDCANETRQKPKLFIGKGRDDCHEMANVSFDKALFGDSVCDEIGHYLE